MKFTSSRKLYSTAALCVCGLSVILQSCSKNAEPEPVVVKSAIVAKSGIDVPLYTGNTNGSGTTVGGGSSGGTTPGGTGNANNNGGQDIPLGASNTIVVYIGTEKYTLSNPADLVNFEVDSSPLVFTGVAAGTETSQRSFGLMSGGTKAGIFGISLLAVKVNGVEYLASEGDGKVNYSKFEVSNEVNGVAKTGTLQGTFDVTATDVNSGKTARITGSFNITQ